MKRESNKMNPRISLLAILLITLSSSWAQQPSRFPIKPGSVWRINYEYSSSDYFCSHLTGDEEYKYFIDGDTMVGVRTYFKLYKTGILFLEEPFRIEHKYMGAIRDSADRFFYIAGGERSEKLLYDFSVNVGDSIQVDGNSTKYPVDEIDTLENGRKRYFLYLIIVHCGSANTLIEGIGWLGGLLEGNSCSGHPGVRGSYLVCYSEDGQPVYETDHMRCGEPVVCSNIITSVSVLKKSLQPEVFVMPGGVLQVRLPQHTREIVEIRIFDATGAVKISNQTVLTEPVDIRNLDSGIYLMRLSSGNDTYATKFVIP